VEPVLWACALRCAAGLAGPKWRDPSSLLGIAAGALYGLFPASCLPRLEACWERSSPSARSVAVPFGHRAASVALRRLRSLDLSVSQDGWKLVFLLRLSPIMPFSATSYLLGLSSVSLLHYTVGRSRRCRRCSAMSSSARSQMLVFRPRPAVTIRSGGFTWCKWDRNASPGCVSRPDRVAA